MATSVADTHCLHQVSHPETFRSGTGPPCYHADSDGWHKLCRYGSSTSECIFTFPFRQQAACSPCSGRHRLRRAPSIRRGLRIPGESGYQAADVFFRGQECAVHVGTCHPRCLINPRFTRTRACCLKGRAVEPEKSQTQLELCSTRWSTGCHSHGSHGLNCPAASRPSAACHADGRSRASSRSKSSAAERQVPWSSRHGPACSFAGSCSTNTCSSSGTFAGNRILWRVAECQAA